MFKKIFSFFLLSFLFFSTNAMANSYTMPDTLLDYINNQSPTVSVYTSIKNDGSSTSDSLFSIKYYDENNAPQELFFNVYNGDSLVKSFGERITNPTGNINSNFIGLSEVASSGNAEGGAIHNNANSSIFNITGDFIGNYAYGSSTAYGGAISNFNSSIGNITGSFIGNYTGGNESSGGAIHNMGEIGDITGDFIGNYASGTLGAQGGAIYNNNNSTIGKITGDFIGNYASGTWVAQGGAIYNNSGSHSTVIENIIGNFIGNYASSTSGNAYGGAIYNYANTNATINSISGNFIGNYAKSTTTSAYGGAIANLAGNISFLADNRTSSFTDNYTFDGTDKTYNAIYNDAGELTFIMKGNGSFVMNDSITGTGALGGNTTININGQNANKNIFYLNDSMTDNEVTISNATLKLGSYIHNDGTKTSWVGTNADMDFTNSLLDIDFIDFDFTGASPYEVLFRSELTFDNDSAFIVRNANIGNYEIGSGSSTYDTYSSASSLHTITKGAANSFTVSFDPTSTLISNSQLGKFMSEINDNFSAQSTSSANRFIFQASQVGTDTKKQAALVDGGAQLNAMGASHALARSAISAKQGTINARISQELAYNVENFIAFNDDIDGIMTIEKKKDISLWLMPHYTHERVSGMDSGSFAHGYTSHLFGLTLGADKTFYKDYSSYSLGLALDAGLGVSNARGDIENIKNNFNNYGATAYASLNKNNFIFSTNLGYERGNNEVSLNMEAYDALENQYADITSNALFASAKAEYNIDMLYFYHSKEDKKREAAEVAKLQAEQEAQKLEELAMRENAEDPDSLPEPTVYEEIPDYEMPSFFAMLYGETHRKNAKYTVKEDYDRTMSFLFVPYIGLDFMTINSGEYEVYSYNTSNKTDTTFNVESERQNVFTIPLGIQIKPELAEMNGIKVSPQLKLGLAYSFGDLAEKSTTTAKDLSAIAYLETENIDALRGDFGLSVNIAKTNKASKSFMNNINFDLGYDLEVSKNRFSHSLFAKASYEF